MQNKGQISEAIIRLLRALAVTQNGLSVVECSALMGVSRQSAYDALRRLRRSEMASCRPSSHTRNWREPPVWGPHGFDAGVVSDRAVQVLLDRATWMQARLDRQHEEDDEQDEPVSQVVVSASAVPPIRTGAPRWVFDLAVRS